MIIRPNGNVDKKVKSPDRFTDFLMVTIEKSQKIFESSRLSPKKSEKFRLFFERFLVFKKV